MTKKISLLPFLIVLLTTLFSPKSLAFNEVCSDEQPCCVPPEAISDGGGCPAGQYWIGNPLTGSCQLPIACIPPSIFQCATNTCDSGGNVCTTTAVETGICCADGQVAVRDDASVTGWSCGDLSGASPWLSDAFGPYVQTTQVGIGQPTGASTYSLSVKADGNNIAATAGAIIANSTMANSVGISADGVRAGGIFTSSSGGAALQALSQTAIEVLSDITKNAGTAVGFFQALAGGTNEIQLGSGTNFNVAFLRNSIAFIRLVDTSGLRQYVNFVTGTEAGPTSFESGYVLVGDVNAAHLAIDPNEIQAKATNATAATLELNTGSTGNVEINLAHNSYATSVCRSGEILGTCSSLRKLKKEIETLSLGLKEVMQLHPVEFKWKDKTVLNDEKDLGFIAEETVQVNPVLAEYDAEGNLTGVRYAQLTSLLTKAIQEQQVMIESQQKQIDQLKTLICSDHPEAELCKTI